MKQSDPPSPTPEIYMKQIMENLVEVHRLTTICAHFEVLNDASGFWMAGDKIIERMRKVAKLLNGMKDSFLANK